MEEIIEYLSKGELSLLLSRIYNAGFLTCDDWKIGYNVKINRYEIKLLKNNDMLRITLATNKTLNLSTIRKQLDKYIERIS